MLLTDVSNLFIEISKKQTAERIANNFGKERKWVSYMKYCNSFKVNPEFLAGLNEYGYELMLVKKGGGSCESDSNQ